MAARATTYHLDYSSQRHRKILVYNIKQQMVIELTYLTFSTIALIIRESSILCKATRNIKLRQGGRHFEQLTS
jgi:hypothetical protein